MRSPAPDARRRALCAALPLLAAGRLRAAGRLPAADLIVELRLVDSVTVVEGEAARASVTIDSRGNLRGTVGTSSVATTRGSNRGVQAVRVRNGGQARMQLVQTQALVGAAAAWSGCTPGAQPPGHGLDPRLGCPVGQRPDDPPGRPPGYPPGNPPTNPPVRPPDPPTGWGDHDRRGGGQRRPPGGGQPGGWPGAGIAGSVITTWAELVDGFEVRPSWPGGQAPVAVEVGAQRSAGAAGSNAPPPRLEVYTTLLAPLGEWVELAQVQRGASATVSTGRATVGTQQALQLQLRVRPAD